MDKTPSRRWAIILFPEGAGSPNSGGVGGHSGVGREKGNRILYSRVKNNKQKTAKRKLPFCCFVLLSFLLYK
jgi:hypothetical protein